MQKNNDNTFNQYIVTMESKGGNLYPIILAATNKWHAVSTALRDVNEECKEQEFVPIDVKLYEPENDMHIGA